MKQKILIIILLLSLFGAGFGFRWYWMKTHKVEVYVPSVPVKQGDFLITIIDTGILKARKNTLVNIPEATGRDMQYKISKLIPEGTKVVKGDPIVWFDPTDLEKEIKQGEFDMKQSQSELDGRLERLRLTKENRAKLMREKKLDWDSAKLELELEQKRRRFYRRMIMMMRCANIVLLH
jgi:multidrug efflux pump subunit AcrA (membrane-fusion protein)